ncbi:hypothetical protein [Caulobacter sp. BP25]|uniref:hypothetical protein n=1 Tax=Caulobacter sp. BP25 TaxID=2048900 RepID=UPI000C12B3F4|nr:hypothetical protein [Caulobacter sp. BP25]PHY20785.1 hypothetical protein CSW59_06060 [Caulobacter sp. BP25]
MSETLVFQVASAEICERVVWLADETVAAGIEIARQMDPPGTPQQVIDFGGTSHALQAVLKQARRRGFGDDAIFAALASAIGAFAKHQMLGPIDCVCAQLAHNGARAARAVSETEAADLPTRGNA